MFEGGCRSQQLVGRGECKYIGLIHMQQQEVWMSVSNDSECHYITLE